VRSAECSTRLKKKKDYLVVKRKLRGDKLQYLSSFLIMGYLLSDTCSLLSKIKKRKHSNNSQVIRWTNSFDPSVLCFGRSSLAWDPPERPGLNLMSYNRDASDVTDKPRTPLIFMDRIRDRVATGRNPAFCTKPKAASVEISATLVYAGKALVRPEYFAQINRRSQEAFFEVGMEDTLFFNKFLPLAGNNSIYKMRTKFYQYSIINAFREWKQRTLKAKHY